MCKKFKRVPQTPFKGSDFTEEEQLVKVEENFREILEVLGMDLEDDSIVETPKRVAKMFVKELFTGLKEENFPKITVQENKFGYDQMLIEVGIEVKTVCEHHFQNIVGKAHIAYIPNKKVVGLSKLNRVTEYFCRRPQVQERLTEQIQKCLQEVLDNEDVAVVIDARHYCVKMRGVEHPDCTTRTITLGGKFKKGATRTEFFNSIPRIES